MKTKHILTTIFLLFFMQTFAQKIKQGEYFYDTDPGVGAGTQIIISTPADSVSPTFTFSTAGLNNTGLFKGFHQIYVRFKDSLNRWGIADAYPFYVYDTSKTTAPILSARLNAGEYFIDTDPGVGLGTGIPSITIGDSVFKTFSFSTAGLINNGLFAGLHQLYYRFRDTSGRWGFTDNMPFTVYDTTRANQIISAQINRGEYFIDTDPGLGNGTVFTFTGPIDSVQTSFNLSTTGLSVGVHNIFIRFRGTDGKWGITDQKQFSVCASMPTAPSLTGNSTYNVLSGANASFSATPASGATIFWRGPNGFTATTNTINLSNITSTKTGTYSAYSVKGATGCDTSLATSVEVVIVNNIQLNLKAYLQGLYLGNGKMIASPNSANGTTSISIADTINVEIRNTTGAYSVAFSAKATLDTAGNANISFPSAALGNSYYIVVNHRNSIATWSASPITMSATTNYNFTTAANKAAGNNLQDYGSGKYLIFSGDINQDGSVDFNDYPDLDISSSNGDLGYLPYDLNGDASVDFNDYPILDINSSNGIIAITP